MEQSPETWDSWLVLIDVAMRENNMVVVERGLAAVCDVPRLRFLGGITGSEKGAVLDPTTKAKLAAYRGDYSSFLGSEYVVTENVDLLLSVHMWEQVLAVTKSPDIGSRYERWLQETGQLEGLARHMLQKGDSVSAIELFLQAGIWNRNIRFSR